jgi:hypothetical protein
MEGLHCILLAKICGRRIGTVRYREGRWYRDFTIALIGYHEVNFWTNLWYNGIQRIHIVDTVTVARASYLITDLSTEWAFGTSGNPKSQFLSNGAVVEIGEHSYGFPVATGFRGSVIDGKVLTIEKVCIPALRSTTRQLIRSLGKSMSYLVNRQQNNECPEQPAVYLPNCILPYPELEDWRKLLVDLWDGRPHSRLRTPAHRFEISGIQSVRKQQLRKPSRMNIMETATGRGYSETWILNTSHCVVKTTKHLIGF